MADRYSTPIPEFHFGQWSSSGSSSESSYDDLEEFLPLEMNIDNSLKNTGKMKPKPDFVVHPLPKIYNSDEQSLEHLEGETIVIKNQFPDELMQTSPVLGFGSTNDLSFFNDTKQNQNIFSNSAIKPKPDDLFDLTQTNTVIGFDGSSLSGINPFHISGKVEKHEEEESESENVTILKEEQLIIESSSEEEENFDPLASVTTLEKAFTQPQFRPNIKNELQQRPNSTDIKIDDVNDYQIASSEQNSDVPEAKIFTGSDDNGNQNNPEVKAENQISDIEDTKPIFEEYLNEENTLTPPPSPERSINTNPASGPSEESTQEPENYELKRIPSYPEIPDVFTIDSPTESKVVFAPIEQEEQSSICHASKYFREKLKNQKSKSAETLIRNAPKPTNLSPKKSIVNHQWYEIIPETSDITKTQERIQIPQSEKISQEIFNPKVRLISQKIEEKPLPEIKVTPKKIKKDVSSDSLYSDDGWEDVPDEPINPKPKEQTPPPSPKVPEKPKQLKNGPLCSLFHLLIINKSHFMPELKRISKVITITGIFNVPKTQKENNYSIQMYFNAPEISNFIDVPLIVSSKQGHYPPAKENQFLIHFPLHSPLYITFKFMGSDRMLCSTNLLVNDQKLLNSGKYHLSLCQRPAMNCITKHRGIDPCLDISYADVAKNDENNLRILPSFSIIPLRATDATIAFCENIKKIRTSEEHPPNLILELSSFSIILSEFSLIKSLKHAFSDEMKKLPKEKRHDTVIKAEIFRKALSSIISNESIVTKPFNTHEISQLCDSDLFSFVYS